MCSKTSREKKFTTFFSSPIASIERLFEWFLALHYVCLVPNNVFRLKCLFPLKRKADENIQFSLNEAPVSLKASHHQHRWFCCCSFVPNLYRCWWISLASACLRSPKINEISSCISVFFLSFGECEIFTRIVVFHPKTRLIMVRNAVLVQSEEQQNGKSRRKLINFFAHVSTEKRCQIAMKQKQSCNHNTAKLLPAPFIESLKRECHIKRGKKKMTMKLSGYYQHHNDLIFLE